jgi:hypothetical protein
VRDVVYAPLHRDEVDGCIVLIRHRGDCWNVARSQEDCDFIRNTEVQSSSKTRLGLAGFSEDLHFVRVKRIDEERIERPTEDSGGGS